MRFNLFATSVALLSSAASASSVLKADSKTAQDLFQKARRVQEQQDYNQYYANAAQGGGYYYGGAGGDGGGENEQYWLADYTIKMLSCISGEQSINYERGEVESSTVIFRLCPANSCNSNSTMGCDAGYGDYAVGINTFAEAFAESVRDNYQYYDVNQMQEYFRECKELEGGNYYNGGYTYIGPACSADGKNIRLATFSDPYCMYESDNSQSMYGGMQLPYSNGGLIPETCMGCYAQNYENWEWEVSDMCLRTYEDAGYRCEDKMESYNWYYGKITQGCDYLESKVGSMSNSDVAAKSFFEETSQTVEKNETLQWALLFVGAACVSGVIVLLLVRNKRARCNKGFSLEDDESEEGGLEIIDANDAKEMIQKSHTSAVEAMKSATNNVKKSIHNSAKRVAAMTRSSSNARKDSQATDKDEAYVTMDGDSDDDYVFT